MTAPGAALSRWMPTSPCSPACVPPAPLPDGPAGRTVRALRVAVRLAGVGALLAVGLLLALASPLLGPARTGRVQARWARALLGAAGVRVRRRGRPLPPGALVVANHVSWLDVLAIVAVDPVRLLAKAEVRSWPLIGVMAVRVGTVFLDRDRLRSLPGAVADVAATLRSGGRVAVFAEGTTRCGRERGPFRPAAFQAAIDAGAPVVPVALRYTDAAGAPVATPAFVGDDTLWSSLARVVAAPRVVVDLEVGGVLDPRVPAGPGRAAGRRDLAARCAAHIESALAPLPPAVWIGRAPRDTRVVDRVG